MTFRSVVQKYPALLFFFLPPVFAEETPSQNADSNPDKKIYLENYVKRKLPPGLKTKVVKEIDQEHKYNAQ